MYEELFKVYVTRVNFKMRMRKLHVRSIRAASIVRVKLIELGALPPHCPVCGLILVSQVCAHSTVRFLESPPSVKTNNYHRMLTHMTFV